MTGISDFYRGDTKTYNIILRGSNNTPISVHNGTLTFTMKKKLSLLDSEASVHLSAPTIESDPLNPTGMMSITLTSTNTNIDPVEYFYDFQFTSESGQVTTLLSDKVKVLADVSRGT